MFCPQVFSEFRATKKAKMANLCDAAGTCTWVTSEIVWNHQGYMVFLDILDIGRKSCEMSWHVHQSWNVSQATSGFGWTHGNNKRLESSPTVTRASEEECRSSYGFPMVIRDPWIAEMLWVILGIFTICSFSNTLRLLQVSFSMLDALPAVKSVWIY